MQAAIRRGGPLDGETVAQLYIRMRHAAVATGTIPPLVRSGADVREWMTHVVTKRLEAWLAELPERRIVGLLVLEEDWIDQL
jgi:hypothetical protein